MTNSTKKILVTVVVMAVIAGAAIFGYFQMTRTPNGEGGGASTEVAKLLKKDMESDYPGTPREVIKLYGRITKCLYNDDLSKEQTEGLLEQVRKLYDEELLAENPWETHLNELNEDVKDYHKNEKVIMSCTVQKSSQVKRATLNEKEAATVYMLFLGKDKNGSFKICERFLLRKDEADNWKIVGWELADPDSVEIGTS